MSVSVYKCIYWYLYVRKKVEGNVFYSVTKGRIYTTNKSRRRSNLQAVTSTHTWQNPMSATCTVQIGATSAWNRTSSRPHTRQPLCLCGHSWYFVMAQNFCRLTLFR